MKHKKEHTDNINFNDVLQRSGLSYSDLDFTSSKTTVDKIYCSTISAINGTPESKSHRLRSTSFVRIMAAAAVFFGLVLGINYFYKSIAKPVYSVIQVDYGDKITVHVTENLTIWLNSESELKLPSYPGRKPKICLDGEAYIEFTPSRSTKEITIQLANNMVFKTRTGHFHVKEEAHSQALVAQVYSGSLNIFEPDVSRKSLAELKEGHTATCIPNADFISIEQGNNKNMLAWKSGKLSFEKEKLEHVVASLSDYFYIPITITNNSLKAEPFSGEFTQPEIDQVLSKIQALYNCSITGDGTKILIE